MYNSKGSFSRSSPKSRKPVGRFTDDGENDFTISKRISYDSRDSRRVNEENRGNNVSLSGHDDNLRGYDSTLRGYNGNLRGSDSDLRGNDYNPRGHYNSVRANYDESHSRSEYQNAYSERRRSRSPKRQYRPALNASYHDRTPPRYRNEPSYFSKDARKSAAIRSEHVHGSRRPEHVNGERGVVGSNSSRPKDEQDMPPRNINAKTKRAFYAGQEIFRAWMSIQLDKLFEKQNTFSGRRPIASSWRMPWPIWQDYKKLIKVSEIEAEVSARRDQKLPLHDMFKWTIPSAILNEYWTISGVQCPSTGWLQTNFELVAGNDQASILQDNGEGLDETGDNQSPFMNIDRSPINQTLDGFDEGVANDDSLATEADQDDNIEQDIAKDELRQVSIEDKGSLDRPNPDVQTLADKSELPLPVENTSGSGFPLVQDQESQQISCATDNWELNRYGRRCFKSRVELRKFLWQHIDEEDDSTPFGLLREEIRMKYERLNTHEDYIPDGWAGSPTDFTCHLKSNGRTFRITGLMIDASTQIYGDMDWYDAWLLINRRKDLWRLRMDSYRFDKSHLCHNGKYCVNPQHIVVEGKEANQIKRKSCQTSGSCECGLEPPCLTALIMSKSQMKTFKDSLAYRKIALAH